MNVIVFVVCCVVKLWPVAKDRLWRELMSLIIKVSSEDVGWAVVCAGSSFIRCSCCSSGGGGGGCGGPAVAPRLAFNFAVWGFDSTLGAPGSRLQQLFLGGQDDRTTNIRQRTIP